MRKRSQLISTLVVCLSLTSLASGGQSAGGSATETIDGAVNPELIPDRIAFRLFFGTVGESRPAPGSGASIAPVVASARQRAKFALMKLNEADQAVLASALSDFKSDFRKAMGEVSKANALAKVGTKPSSPPAALLDDVTQQTLDKLKNTMSPDGFQKLKDHVRSEKRNMKIIPLQMAMHK